MASELEPAAECSARAARYLDGCYGVLIESRHAAEFSARVARHLA